MPFRSIENPNIINIIKITSLCLCLLNNGIYCYFEYNISISRKLYIIQINDKNNFFKY